MKVKISVPVLRMTIAFDWEVVKRDHAESGIQGLAVALERKRELLRLLIRASTVDH